MTTSATRTTAFLVLIAASTISPAVAEDESTGATTRHLTIGDYGAIHALSAPRISPDAKHITYVLDGQIFLVSGDGAEPRALTSSASSAWGNRWSADGDSIYFLSDRDNASQIYKLSVGEPGEAAQVTNFTHGVSSINLSPDESRMLLAISDDQLREQPEEPEPIVVTRRHFKRDAGDGYIADGTLNHLYVYDIESQEMRKLTTGPYHDGGGTWSPDGHSVVFTSNRQEIPDTDNRKDLFIVAVDSVAGESSPIRLTDSSRTKSSAAWSPDGKEIAYLSGEAGPYGVSHITVIPAAGGDPRILTTELDRMIGAIEYSSDGAWIYFRYQDSGAAHLARVRVRDSKMETLVEGDRVVGDFHVSDSGVIAFAASDRLGTADIHQLSRTRVTKLTDVNREFFNEVTLGEKTKVSFESEDGTVVEAFITTPPDYDDERAYPAILNIHGGPVSQFSWGFGFTTQYFASQGYVVIEPNPRGSAGRGQEFIRAIYRAWGVPDYADVIAAVDFAVAEGIADPDKLFVRGYSYGGYMTNVVITQTDRFKAAVSGAGHSLIEANVGHDIYGRWYFWELGVPWENREKYDVHSPLLRAGNVTTPTLFLGGSIDWNVPLLNLELFYQALKFQGIDTELVVYPGVHHGGWPETFELDYIKRTEDWFERYLNRE